MTEADDDDDRPGLTKEQTDQLRALMIELEAKLKHYHRNADIDRLTEQLRRLCKAAETSDTDEIVKSVRNITEGVIGGLIVDMIPADTKAWLRTAIIGAGAASATTKPQHQLQNRIDYIVKVELDESVRALEMLAEERAFFLMSVSDPGSGSTNTPCARFWCDDVTAVYLRLGLDKAWVERPTREEVEDIIENGSISSSNLPTMKKRLEELIATHKLSRLGPGET